MALLLALALMPGPARAQSRAPAVADSAAGPAAPAGAPAAADSASGMAARARALMAADSARGDLSPDSARAAARADTATGGGALKRSRDRIRLALGPTPFFDQPRWVMLRSAVLPGWGQLHNGSWMKAVAVAGLEGMMGTELVNDFHELDRLDLEVAAARTQGDIEGENALVARYNDRLNTAVRRQWLLAGVVIYAMLDAYVDAHFRNFKIEFENDPALPGGKDRGGARLSVRWGF